MGATQLAFFPFFKNYSPIRLLWQGGDNKEVADIIGG
jgi:hypothetical protein